MKRIALVILAVAVAMAGAAAQDLERLFKAAVNTETVDRNCKAAIEQYKKVAAGANRALAAQALLRMARCYEQLGDAEAQQVYERIVRGFKDQSEAVEVARTRLVGRGPSARPAADRIVWAGAGTTDGEGDVSPDGRFISYVSWGGPKGLNLMLHDLVTGTDRALTDADWNGGAAGDSTFSPDGTQLAFGWNTYSQQGQPASQEIRVIALDGSGSRQARTIYASAQHAANPIDWSKDGTTLAVRVSVPDRTRQLALVGLDGSFRTLKTLDNWRAVSKIFFSPDGAYLAYDAPVSDTDQRRDVFIIAADGRVEFPIHDPADDVVMGWSPDGHHLLVASDRSGRVDLWALPVSNGKPTGIPSRRLKADVGAVDSQGLTESGALYVVKDASTMNLQVASIDLSQGRLTGPPRVQIFRTETPAWSRDGKFLAYQARSPNGQAHLAIRELASNRVRELRPAFVYMPQLQWLSDGRSLIVGGRDTRGQNRSIRMDVETGAETPITRGGDVSVDGTKVYYAVGQNNRSGVVTEQDLASGATRAVFMKPDATGAPRLSPDGKLIAVVQTPSIDSNKPGKTSTVIIASVADGSVRNVSVPAVLEAYRGFDWTPDSRAVLVATNPDSGDSHLWLVPGNGDPPRKLDIDTRGWITSMGIRLHPNGTQIAYFTGEDAREVWALENIIPAVLK